MERAVHLSMLPSLHAAMQSSISAVAACAVAISAVTLSRAYFASCGQHLLRVCNAALAEGLRWRSREGALYFSDMHAGKVVKLAPGSAPETVLTIDADDPSGLGWLPDGRLLLVRMLSRSLAAWDPATRELVAYADLSSIQPLKSNDLCVDCDGNAYVGGFGLNDPDVGDDNKAAHETSEVTLVRPPAAGAAQRVETAASGILFPNGTVITPDGRTMIVAETFGARLTAWERDLTSARLSSPRCWAELPGCYPDGMCLDAEGAVWVAICATQLANRLRSRAATLLAYVRAGQPTGAVCRVHEGGRISQCIFLADSMAVACMLGGADGRTLYVSCAASTVAATCKAAGTSNGYVGIVRVAVPAATADSCRDYWGGCC